MMKISDAAINEELGPYQVALLPGVHEQIRIYISLLLKWNRKVSLTTVTDPIEALRFHFGESIFAASEVNFSRSRLADVGSGAGFPGLPLAMMIPGVDVTLIESNTKKCAFLSEVTRELDFSNVTVFRGRMEDLPINSDPFGFVTARALGHHDDLLKWASGRLSSGGKAILWLGDQDATNLSRRTDWNWGERALIPGSERRYILSGSLKR